MKTIGIVGLGYVGLTLGVALAQRGLSVHGIERRQQVVDLTNKGVPHFSEEGLGEALADVYARNLFRATSSFDGVPACDAYVITVGTPLDAEGLPRLDMIENAAREVANHMAAGALVVLRSTVQIGTTRKIILPILVERGIPFHLAMCPERTLEGDALRELATLPQIIGGMDADGANAASALFSTLTNSTIRVSSPETAEMVKLVDNTYRDVIFGFGNEVARACDAVGVNAYEVINYGKLGYSRTNVALPGLVGGPCLEKDPHIFNHSLKEYGIELAITMAARAVNEKQPRETVRQIIYRIGGAPPATKFAILGMAFKGRPETDDLRGSMALKVLDAIRAEGFSGVINVFDPVCAVEDLNSIGASINACANLTEACTGADVILITNNHPAFGKISFDTLASGMNAGGIVYDYWNNFGHESQDTLAGRYFSVGNFMKESAS